MSLPIPVGVEEFCDGVSVCTSGWMDDSNGPYKRTSMPLQRVMSLRSRAQANAPASSYRLRRVLGSDGGRRN